MIALSVIVGAWAFACFVFTVAAISAVRKMVRRSTAAVDAGCPAGWPAITILRPCQGLDSGLEENLLSSVTARYDGSREIWILVPTVDDPAHAIAARVVARAAELAPLVPVRLCATEIETRANRKVAQLAAVAPGALAPVIVVADSDIRFDERTLPALIGVLEADPRAGASSAPYLEVVQETFGDQASAALLSSTPHAFYCLTALAERSGGAHVLCGALIAIKRAVLEEVGGFASLEPFLGEDFELARRLHANRYTIPTSPAPAPVMDRGRTLAWVVRRFSRWCTVTRQQRPYLFSTYTLLLGCMPLILVGCGVALGVHAPFAWIAGALTALALGTRVALGMTLRRSYGLKADPFRALSALLLGEAVIVIAATLALGRPEIEWRGRRYLVSRGGLLDRID